MTSPRESLLGAARDTGVETGPGPPGRSQPMHTTYASEPQRCVLDFCVSLSDLSEVRLALNLSQSGQKFGGAADTEIKTCSTRAVPLYYSTSSNLPSTRIRKATQAELTKLELVLRVSSDSALAVDFKIP